MSQETEFEIIVKRNRISITGLKLHSISLSLHSVLQPPKSSQSSTNRNLIVFQSGISVPIFIVRQGRSDKNHCHLISTRRHSDTTFSLLHEVFIISCGIVNIVAPSILLRFKIIQLLGQIQLVVYTYNMIFLT